MAATRRTARPSEKGVTLLELVIAVAILALLSISIFFALGRGSLAARKARLQDAASQALSYEMEVLRTASVNWSTATGAGGALTIGSHAFSPANLPSGSSGSYTVANPSFTSDGTILQTDLTVTYTFQGSAQTLLASTYIYQNGLNQR